MPPFADVEDLESRWRPITVAGERDRAEELIGDASAMIRVELPDIDRRITVQPPATAPVMDSRIPLLVVCAMVRRAMAGSDLGADVSQLGQTAGPFSQQVTFANPSGDLYLTKKDRKMLGIGRQRAGSVDLAPNAGYCAPSAWLSTDPEVVP